MDSLLPFMCRGEIAVYRKLIQNKNLMFYFLGGSISQLGDIVTGMAFLFLSYDLTGSNLQTTGMVMAETIPYLLFGLIGGVIADWIYKKKLLIFIDLLRAPLVFSIVVLSYMDWLSYSSLLFVGFMIQCFGCFFDPAHRAVLPMITSLDERTAANSIQDTIKRGITVLSPVVSVLFLKTIGVIHFFTFDACTYVLSALFLSGLHFQEAVSSESRGIKEVFLAIKDFGLWVKDQVSLRNLFILTFIYVFFNTWVWQVGLLLRLEQTTEHGKVIYSTVEGWFGLVVIAVNLVIPLIWKKMTMATYIIGASVWGIGIFCLGFVGNLPLFYAAVFIVGLGLPLSGLSRVFLLQKLVPQEKLGRGFSLNAVILYFSNTVSLAFFGWLSTFVSIPYLFIGSGLLMMLISLLFLLIILFPKGGRRFSV